LGRPSTGRFSLPDRFFCLSAISLPPPTPPRHNKTDASQLTLLRRTLSC
jgi:hypothetical protein